MQDNHHHIVWAAKLFAALRERPPRVTLGHHQLRQPFEDDRQDQQVVHGPTT
ncbi:Uncharacterised protein [Mycobacterium tuberculosis]|nr:Uncharacterised protein [Mycobacterium tuberculosis]